MRRLYFLTTFAALAFAPLSYLHGQTGGAGGSSGSGGAASGGASAGATGSGTTGGATGSGATGSGGASAGSSASGGRSGGTDTATGANTQSDGNTGTGPVSPATGTSGRATNQPRSRTGTGSAQTPAARTPAFGQADGQAGAGSPGAGARTAAPRRAARNGSPGVLQREREAANAAAQGTATDTARSRSRTGSAATNRNQTVTNDPNAQSVRSSNDPSLRGSPSTAAGASNLNRGATSAGTADRSTATRRSTAAPSAADTVNPNVNNNNNNSTNVDDDGRLSGAPSSAANDDVVNRGATSLGTANEDTATNRTDQNSRGLSGQDSRFTDRDTDSRFTDRDRDSRFTDRDVDSRFNENRLDSRFTAPRSDAGFDDTQTDDRFSDAGVAEGITAGDITNDGTSGLFPATRPQNGLTDGQADDGQIEPKTGIRSRDRSAARRSADRVTDRGFRDGSVSGNPGTSDDALVDPRMRNRFGDVQSDSTNPSADGQLRSDLGSRARFRDEHSSNAATGAGDRPQLGVTFNSTLDEAATIARVLPNSSASRAGLRAGDQIVSINGRRFDNFEDAFDYIDVFRGSRMDIIVDRDGRQMRVAADLNAPRQMAMGDRPSIGIWFSGANELTIGRTTAGSLAHMAGIRAGDRVLTVDGERVSSQRAITRYLADLQPNERVSIDVLRDGRRVELSGVIAQGNGSDRNEPSPAARTAERTNVPDSSRFEDRSPAANPDRVRRN